MSVGVSATSRQALAVPSILGMGLTVSSSPPCAFAMAQVWAPWVAWCTPSSMGAACGIFFNVACHPLCVPSLLQVNVGGGGGLIGGGGGGGAAAAGGAAAPAEEEKKEEKVEEKEESDDDMGFSLFD